MRSSDVTGLATRIAEASEDLAPIVEVALFGTADPGAIEKAILGFVEDRLGRVAEALFYRPGVGVVVGLRLADEAEVVVKVHRWNVSEQRLADVQTVQHAMVRAGLPAPSPLVAPEPLAAGIATIEALLPGSSVDGHDPEVRRLLAAGLHDFVAAGIDVDSVPRVGHPLMLRPAGAPLWFEPHDLRFDFEATSEGAEWIDELAEQARGALDEIGQLSPVLGHFDWRVQNLGFAQGTISGIYDWDSLAIAPEAVVVGNAAAIFSADWSADEIDPLPTLSEMRDFVTEYEQSAQRPFGDHERKIVDAANLFACAYGARCQHSDTRLHPSIGYGPETGWIRLLHERADQTL